MTILNWLSLNLKKKNQQIPEESTEIELTRNRKICKLPAKSTPDQVQ